MSKKGQIFIQPENQNYDISNNNLTENSQTSQTNIKNNENPTINCIFCLKPQKILSKISHIENNNNNNNNTNDEETTNVMLTNIPSQQPLYYKYEGCSHIICIKCISRILFTNYLNSIPSNSSIILTCNCNQGKLSLSLNQISSLSLKVLEPPPEILCINHNLTSHLYCLDCKKWLCKKCEESHSDLFNNLHHLSKEEPPNLNTCSYHPNCYLDRLCKDCHFTVCHLCVREGNKHYGHNEMSFDDMKKKILHNVDNLKHQNFEEFEKYFNNKNNLYDEQIKNIIDNFNKKIEEILKKIEKCKNNFIKKINQKQKEKNRIFKIIKNLYNFFFNEFKNITKSTDYPVLSLYQVFNSDLISFSLTTPKDTQSYINKILQNVTQIDNSQNYNTKYQFSMKNFSKQNTLKKHTGPINSLCTYSDGRLCSGSEDKTIIIWNRDLNDADVIIKDSQFPVKVIKILNDKRLISGTFKEMRIYNENFKCVNVLKDISNNICDIINLDDGRIISGSYREMRIFNITWNNNYKDSKPVKDHTSWVKTLLKLKGKLFASAGDDKQIYIYDYTIKCVRNIKFESEISVLCLMVNDYDDDDNLNSFYIGDFQGRIFLYNYVLKKFEMISENDQHSNKINCIVPLFGGNYASCSSDNKIIIRDAYFNPIQYLIGNENGKSANSLTQVLNGELCVGFDNPEINIYE